MKKKIMEKFIFMTSVMFTLGWEKIPMINVRDCWGDLSKATKALHKELTEVEDGGFCVSS